MTKKTLDETIADNARSPASVTVDGNTVMAKPIEALIIAKRHEAAQATTAKRRTGFRFFRVNDNPGY